MNKKRTVEEQDEVIQVIDKSGNWIFEGTNRTSHRYLFEMADKIIFIDPPLFLRKYRIIFRYIKQKLGLEKSLYKPTLKMVKMMFQWTKEFEKGRDEFTLFLEQFVDKVEYIG